MSLFEPETPKGRPAFVWLSGIVFVLIVSTLVFHFRFLPETRATNRFFDALVAGDTALAYKIWHPTPSYQMADFLADWGPNGYYGPVKSFAVRNADWPCHPAWWSCGASGVIVTVEVSPFSPFPSLEDLEKTRRTKTVSVWVETKDKSFSFPPSF